MVVYNGGLLYNVVKAIINHPFGNGLYQLFMVIWGMVYYLLNHIRANMVQH